MINKQKAIEIQRDIEKEKKLNDNKELKKIKKVSEKNGKKLIDESFDIMYSNWI